MRPIRHIRLIGLIGLISLMSPVGIMAQTKTAPPTLILSWQAHSYIPSDYPAKALPPRDSTVDVYLTFVDGGTIIPLTKQMVSWQINGEFFVSGVNLNHISFPLNRFTTRTYEIKATIKDYNYQNIEKTVLINRVNPLVSVQASPFLKNTSGTQLHFTARPFFMFSTNPNDYVFIWNINNVLYDARTDVVDVLLPSSADARQTLSVGVSVQHRMNELESVSSRKEFIINN